MSNSSSDLNSENIIEILKLYESHPSVLKIKENVNIASKFSFQKISSQLLKNQISKLNPKKGSVKADIPVKALIMANDIVSDYLCDIYNDSV